MVKIVQVVILSRMDYFCFLWGFHHMITGQCIKSTTAAVFYNSAQSARFFFSFYSDACSKTELIAWLLCFHWCPYLHRSVPKSVHNINWVMPKRGWKSRLANWNRALAKNINGDTRPLRLFIIFDFVRGLHSSDIAMLNKQVKVTVDCLVDIMSVSRI